MSEKNGLKQKFLLTVLNDDGDTDLFPVTETEELILDQEGEEWFSGFLIEAESYNDAENMVQTVQIEDIPKEHIEDFRI